jgi:hypothetical protein
MIPDAITFGDRLAPVIAELQQKKRLEFTQGEKLIYYSYNCASLFKDHTSNCLLLTNRRFIKFSEAKIVASMELVDIRKVQSIPGSGMFRFGHLILSPVPQRGRSIQVGVWKRDAMEFFYKMLTRIAEANKEESRAPPKLVSAKQALEREIDSVLGANPEKGREIRRIMRSSDEELTPSERKLKGELQQEDEQLDRLIESLDRIEELGTDITKELTHQEKLLEHISDKQLNKHVSRVKQSSHRAQELAR